MNNIIIAIIGIALVAVMTITGVYYMGNLLNSSTPQANANLLISQSRQLMTADTEYMLDKGFGSFTDFSPDAPAIAGYTSGRIPILSLDTYRENTAGQISSSLDPTTYVALTYTTTPSLMFSQLNGTSVELFRSQCSPNSLNIR